MIRFLSQLVLILALSIHMAVAEEPIRHSFFVAGPSFTGIIDENGKEVWNSGRRAARDGYVLENGNGMVMSISPVSREIKRKEIEVDV